MSLFLEQGELLSTGHTNVFRLWNTSCDSADHHHL